MWTNNHVEIEIKTALATKVFVNPNDISGQNVSSPSMFGRVMFGLIFVSYLLVILQAFVRFIFSVSVENIYEAFFSLIPYT